MLSLVQELEAFAASDALPDLLRVRGETRSLSALSSGWQALKTVLEIVDVRSAALFHIVIVVASHLGGWLSLLLISHSPIIV